MSGPCSNAQPLFPEWFIYQVYFSARIVKFLHSYCFSYVCFWTFIQLHLQLQSRITLNEFIVDPVLIANLNSFSDSS